MKTILHSTLFTLAALIIAFPTSAKEARGAGEGKAHWEQQHAENEAFRQTLKDKDPEEAVAAIKEHRTTQFQENLIFFSDQKDKREERINSNERLDDDQKAELISFLEVMYANKVAFFTNLHNSTIALLDELAATEDLTKETVKTSLKEHHGKCREAIEEFRKNQREAWQAKREEMIGTVKGRKKAEN